MVYTYQNNIKISNSYKIRIPINIDKKLIKINSNGGGNNIITELITKYINGYEDASYYKIALPRRFKNIKNVKIINIEMSNAQYAIRDRVSKIYNNSSDYIENNNILYWINEEDLTEIKDKFLINNEKALNIVNNNINNIPSEWQRHGSREKTLYEYLSQMYLKKINTNMNNLQHVFINLLYFLKDQIQKSNLNTTQKNIINNEDSYLLKFNINSNEYILYLYDKYTEYNSNKTNYYINDFYSENIFNDFIYKFTNYNFKLNNYNKNLNINFIETTEVSIDTEGPVNIFNYLKIITEDRKNNDPDNKLYFKLINNDQINVEYNYIQYLFNSTVNNIINELKEYSYSNININSFLREEQNNFINYLIDLYNNIVNSLENELDKNIIKYGYLFSFYNTNKNEINNLYFYEKPEDQEDTTPKIKNYNINNLKNNFELFLDFIKNYSTSISNNNLDYINYNINYSFINESTNNIINYTYEEVSSYNLFNYNTEYILPKTILNINNTVINLKKNIYRNTLYKFNIQTDNKLIISTSDRIGIDYNFNNNIINEYNEENNQNKIEINISNYENINNLYILKETSPNTYDIIIHINIYYIDIFNYDFSIYGYIHNISLNNDISFIFNNKLFSYTYINDLFKDHIKNINNELNINIEESYNLLTNKPNLPDQFYWILSNKINTNIYTKSIEQNINSDSMIENKYNYNDILNIRYLNNIINIFNIYPIYSTQIKKGNYIVDDFTNELENKLNSTTRKIYDYKKKLFVDDTIFKIKSGLKIYKNKSIFKIDLNENNNLVKIYQYKNIYEFSLFDIKTDNQTGPFIVNEGYPYIYIKLKNSSLKTGDLISITGAHSFLNFKANEINKEHIVYNHSIYRVTIRFILPLDNTYESINHSENDLEYYYEGNKFIDFSNYKHGLNKIESNNNINYKNLIGHKLKDIILDNDISIYELFTNINHLEIDNKDKTKLGRVLNIKRDSNSNYILDYNLLSDNNFEIGDIIKTNNTNAYIMFIPNDWTHNYLPKTHQIINSNINIIENISEGFSIKLDKIPNQSNLNGMGGININILKSIRFSLLFDKNNTLSESIGFEKKMTDFDLVHTNTYKTEENIIDYTYIEPSYFEDIANNNYIMIKTLINHNYDIGSYIYLNNHLINYNLINSYNNIILNIKEYIPFIIWFNDLPILEQKILKNSLNSETFTHYCEKGIIIYYLYPYTNKQKQHLGNLGMSVENYEDINYFNFKEAPYPNICNLKPNSYIYIKDNQNTVNKIINGINTEYKIGFQDKYYKVLNNIPIYKNSYYKNYFNNTNCALIECDYIRITQNYDLNTINYKEEIDSISNTNESILEGYLNNGVINNTKIETNIVGNINNNQYNYYKIHLLNKIDKNNINTYYPINCTNQYYLNYVNNIYYLNNSNVNELDIYENINYIIDISNINLLNKNIIISQNNQNITPYIQDNNNILNVNGIPGNENSYINIKITNNLINKFYIYIDYLLIFKLNIRKSNTIIYNIDILNNNNIEFINNSTNTILINPILNIEFGVIYRFKFNNLNTYNNFLIINEFFYNIPLNTDYITYNNNELYIEILLTNNNYTNEIFYQLNNTDKTIGKLILGIHNYYNSNRILLINSTYIDNINDKYINENNISKNNDTNIINYITTKNTYYFKINLKMDINTIDNYIPIIPYVNIFYLEKDCIRDTNIIKIKNSYDILYVDKIKLNTIILTEPNYNLYINKLITLQNNIPNSLLNSGTNVYIINIDETFTQIQIGYISDKSLIKINDIENNVYSISFLSYTIYNYKHKNELINKSVKINYLASYNSLINKTYNSKISNINNKKKIINISNRSYYNSVSQNIQIIENNNLQNLNWTTPYGSIYIDLLENNIINYIKFNNINSNNNNHPFKIYLYYIESNITYFINSLTNIINNNIIENNVYNKKKYIIYIETYGLYNNTYSTLNIPEIELGYINPIKNDIAYINKNIKRVSIDNIINKYKISNNILIDNIEDKDIEDIESTEKNKKYNDILLLNNNKSSIIDIQFDTPISIKYYSIIQNSINNNFIIDGKRYITSFNGTITSIQLFGSNYIDYSIEEEIIDAKYINKKVVDSDIDNEITGNSYNSNTYIINHFKTFINNKSFKYYRLKILSNINYYPYLRIVENKNNNETDYVNKFLLELKNPPNEYLFNFNNNTYNIQNNIFNLNISGITVGNYEMIDYSKLYIEDINYIKDVNITQNYIELILKYDLLNSHLAGENIIISNNKTNENLFSTQNLIIYNKWYTRIFYQGYNSIYNSNHILRTEGEYICNFINLINKNENYNIYSNSNYTFKNLKTNNKLDFYEIKFDINTIIYINKIDYNIYNIDSSISSINYENNTYTFFKTKNINYKYLNLDLLNINKLDFEIILLSLEDYDILNNIIINNIYNNINNVEITNCQFNNNKLRIIINTNSNAISTEQEIINNQTLIINCLKINFKKNNNKEGLPVIQEYLTQNIHIEKMNGFYISEDSYELDSNNNIIKTKSNNIIKPVKTMNYDTYTYTYLDLVYKSDRESINITNNNFCNNGIPIFGYFKNNNYIDDHNNSNFYINYYSVTLEGRYQGFGGIINNKTNNIDNLFNNNTEGFKILDIGYDQNNNKNLIKIDLKISELGITKPQVYIGDINDITNITKKNDYIIGYGGNIYQKKIFKNIDALSGPKYLYLSIKHLNYILTTNKTSYFTKILLKSSPGNHLYESSFIDNSILFERTPLDELSELEIKFINDDGKLFDLENTEHTMILEITEYVRNYDNSSYLE